MLKQWIPAAKPDKEELDKRLDAAQEELFKTPDADQGA